MSKDFEVGLYGTIEAAEDALKKIEAQIARYKNSGHKDTLKYLLQYGCVVVRSVCAAISKPTGNHHDIYYDILIRIIAPCLQPTASPTHWSRYLELICYYHYKLVEKKISSDAAKVFNYIMEQIKYLQNENDYQFIMSACAQYLLGQYSYKQKDAAAAHQTMLQVIDAYVALFAQMLYNHKQLNFNYPTLITDFLKQLIPKRLPNYFTYIATLPAQKSQMYTSLFKLLAEMKPAIPAENEVAIECSRYLDAFTVFLQLDVHEVLKQQLSLEFLRICRDMPILQSNQIIGYFFSLMYYFIKLVLTQTLTNKATLQPFIEICGKFRRFFDISAANYIGEQWLRDALVTLYLFVIELHKRNSTYFQKFWTRLTSVKCYSTNFEFLQYLMSLFLNVRTSQFWNPTCCTNVGKHMVVSMANAALNAYSNYVMNVTAEEEKQEIELVTTMNTTFVELINEAYDVMSSLSCLNGESAYTKSFYAYLAQLTRDVKTPTQAQLCITLTENLSKIKTIFNTDDWILMLRRNYKTAILTENKKLTAELQCCYIAALASQQLNNIDLSLLFNQIAIYYGTKPEQTVDNKCLLEVYNNCQSSLKPQLTLQQKRLWHWLELQCVSMYLRTNIKLLSSLLSNSITDYDIILTIHSSLSLVVENKDKLRYIVKNLRFKMQPNAISKLKRLEQLTFAHATTMLHSQEMEDQTIKLVNINFTNEDNIEELLQMKELETISINTELLAINRALESLEAFELFYYKADTEFISSDDALIDWDFILDDITSLALYFQFAGFIECAIKAWRLHYTISKSLEHDFNVIRSLSFFLEYASHFDSVDDCINLQQEIPKILPILTQHLGNLEPLLKRHQSTILVCLCNLAYYYAQNGNFFYAQQLLECVKLKHEELTDRKGVCDIVYVTLGFAKFLINWKPINSKQFTDDNNIAFNSGCLIREIELLLERMREFKVISSVDRIAYMMYLFKFIEQVAECIGNRLCDNVLSNYFACSFNYALEAQAALRVVKILTSWMWINLQMENVGKAQQKLKIIECIIGMKDVKEVAAKISTKKLAIKDIPKLAPPTKTEDFEMMRKVAYGDVTPIEMRMTTLSPSTFNKKLTNYLNPKIFKKPLQDTELLQLLLFNVACMNARLYFLIDDYEQLEDFYECCFCWLKNKKNTFLLQNFQNVQILSMTHYANYLRANKKYDKALNCIDMALKFCKQMSGKIDSFYHINFMLQMHATKLEMERPRQLAINYSKSNTIMHDTPALRKKNLRRALEFDLSPPEQENIETPITKKVSERTAASSITKRKMKTVTVSRSDVHKEQQHQQQQSLTINSAIAFTPISTLTSNFTSTSAFTSKSTSSATLTAKNLCLLSSTTSDVTPKLKLKQPKRTDSSDSASSDSLMELSSDLDLNVCQQIDISDTDNSIICSEDKRPIKKALTTVKKQNRKTNKIRSKTPVLSSNYTEHFAQQGSKTAVKSSSISSSSSSARHLIVTPHKPVDVIDLDFNAKKPNTLETKTNVKVKKNTKTTEAMMEKFQTLQLEETPCSSRYLLRNPTAAAVETETPNAKASIKRGRRPRKNDENIAPIAATKPTSSASARRRQKI